MERSEKMFKIRAAELRGILVELSPAFIKIAQAFSSRPDVIPPSYLEELSLLQDRIAPFSTKMAFELIVKELGLPLDIIFSEITSESVAAASLGQVYQARLRSSGQIVAIKVQRPGVQLQAVVDEWASSLFKEMDYRFEARNGLKFRHEDVLLRDASSVPG